MSLWKSAYLTFFLWRNAATDTVNQELIYVGDESGKMIAMRNIIQKVESLHIPVTLFMLK